MVICCCSLKSLVIVVTSIAFFIAVANPILNEFIAPLDPKKEDSSNDDSRPPFDPTVTDVLSYNDMYFMKEGHDAELNMGLTYILQQSFPRWMIKLLQRYEPENDFKTEKHPIDILDARKVGESEIPFDESGFTLIDMKDDPSIQTVKNWRSQTDIKPFQDKLEPHLRKLFPDATRIEFTYNVVRGGNQFGDQPAAINGPHLDYSQNDTARIIFHEEYPVMEQAKEHNLLLGKENTDDEEMKYLLGIWKPIGMRTGVCDYPLAMMDARTFSPSQETLYPIHINFGVFTFHNLNGGICHHNDQKWYYYPFQKDSEVLIFTQYSKGRYFSNPHSSFENPNCPANTDPRVSVEMRAAVFMKK